MLRSSLAFFLALSVACLASGQAWAVFPNIQEFDNDTDSYTPNSDPLNDPELDGSPPGVYRDIRTGNSGFIEEVASGHLGVVSSSGGNHGVIYGESGDGPYGFPHTSPLPLGSWSHQMDLYIDPTIPTSLATGANDGTPDFWWTNSIGPGYVTESGWTAQVEDNGVDPKYWSLTTTVGGQPEYRAELGKWYTLEVYFHEDTNDGSLAATHNLYNQEHTQLLLSITLNQLFLDPPASAGQQPGYQWWPFIESNMDHITIDRVGVAAPIELVSSYLLGDMDGNGEVDNFDIGPFELALTDSAAYLAQYPALTDYALRGDINQDNTFDNFDIGPFEVLLTSGPGPAAVPEPSSIVLLGAGSLGLAFAVRRRRTR